MPWQADLMCKRKPVVLDRRLGRHLECEGHYYHEYAFTYRHIADVYWKEPEIEMLTDDWGFIIPSVVDDPKDFEAGKLVCATCGCYVHRDKRESHREKCEHA